MANSLQHLGEGIAMGAILFAVQPCWELKHAEVVVDTNIIQKI